MDRKIVIDKLEFLKRYDRNQQTLYGFKTYGANRHKFKLNPTINADRVRQFEFKNRITLPKDYFEFITEIGNGGAGPGNGLHQLEKWDYDLQNVDDNFLSTKFPHNEPWNIKYQFPGEDNRAEEYKEFENEYYSNKQVAGAIRVSDYGCGINYMLVVTGEQKGKIWVDDRCSNYGIYDLKTNDKVPFWTFENWYMDWLDKSISDLNIK
jgi:hypothetical protein